MSDEKPTVEFDAEKHEYRVNGEVWPSVTTICSAWKEAVTGKPAPWDNPAIPAETMEKINFARDKGISVHEAIALDLNGNLDWTKLDPQIAGYMEAYRKACSRLRLKKAKDLKVEQIIVGEGYCGTLDVGTKWILLDWKTGQHDWTHWMQLSAYRKTMPGLHRAGACYLKNDGTYEIKWMPKEEYRRSLIWFWAAMDLMGCRKAHTRK